MKQIRAMATLARSWQLLRSFRFEQTRPDIFYGGLASDTALLVDALCTDLGLPLSGARVLDEDVASGVSHLHGAVLRNLEGLVVGAILLSFLSHQAASLRC